MRNLAQLTASKILSIEMPESLFSNSLAEAKQEYRLLSRQWHPDCTLSTDGMQVFMHISELYRSAKQKFSNGEWDTNCQKIEDQARGIRRFSLSDGSVKTCKYHACHSFELGKMYVSDNSVSFEIERELLDLFEIGRMRIHMLSFKNDAMALEISKYLPQIKHEFKTGATHILVVRKTPDQLLLSDVLNYFNGAVQPINHVGWILNNLLNLACYLQCAGLTHNEISSKSVFISPLRHGVMLLGGWWYATKESLALTYIPEETLPFIPPDIIRNKRADCRVDLELIRALGREMLGDIAGANLAHDKSLPPHLVEWLLLPSSGSAIEDYKTFKREVLPNSFGPPKFVSMQLDANQLYKEN